MKATTKRFYSLVGSIALFASALFIYSSLIQPEYANIQTLRGEREAKQQLLLDYKSTSTALNDLLQKYKSFSELQNTLSMSLPLGDESSQVFNQVQGIATLSKVRLDSLSLQYLAIDYANKGSSVIKPIGKLRITMKLIGRYEDFKNFLSTIETNVRIIDVISLGLEGGALSRGANLNYNLVVDTYYQSEN